MSYIPLIMSSRAGENYLLLMINLDPAFVVTLILLAHLVWHLHIIFVNLFTTYDRYYKTN